MDAPVRNPQDESIADLLTRAIDEGRAYARAEVDLYKEIARHRGERAKSGLIALTIGAVLAWFAAIALLLGLVFGLATLIGPLAAGIVVAIVLGAAGGFLVMKGLKGVRALSGDEEERAALSQGAQR